MVCVVSMVYISVYSGFYGDIAMTSSCDRRHIFKAKAFTLLELVVVMAVIGLLLALAIPVLNKAAGVSRLTVCMNNMRQLSMAIHTYSAMNDGFLPPSARNNNWQLRYPGNSDPALGGPPWYERLKDSNLLDYEATDAGLLHCPSDERDKPFASYSANRHVMGFSDPRNQQERSKWPVRKMSKLKGNLSNLILLGERGPLENAEWAKVGRPWSMSGTSVTRFGGYASRSEVGFYLGRHGVAELTNTGDRAQIINTEIPFAMVDGHVEKFSGDIDCDIIKSHHAVAMETGYELDRAFISASPSPSWPKLMNK